MRACLSLLMWCVLASGALAQEPKAVAPAEAKAATKTANPRIDTQAEPKIERIVVQDDGVRIEELRVRGQTQRIVVKPKHGAEYEIVVPAGGRDPGTNRAGQRGDASGQRVWRVLEF
jgi:Protein of unknown function (DUF2782)